MSSEKSLKDENAWLIRGVLACHFAAFAFVAFKSSGLAGQITVAGMVEQAEAFLKPGSLSLVLIVLTKLWLLGLVPPGVRDQVIHWRRQHPLPGARAFTEIGPASSRVDMQTLDTLHGPLPSDPGEQDRLFYRIYSQYRDEVPVQDPHRSYLAARDIGTINLLLTLPLPVLAGWVTADAALTVGYAVVLLLIYTVTAFAAQRYGERLVENTLAVASAEAAAVSGSAS